MWVQGPSAPSPSRRRLHKPRRAPRSTQAARGTTMTDHDLLNPVVLLRDGKGVYGIGLSDEYLQAREGRCENIKLILRPDRIDEAILRPYRIGEAYGRDYPACLQGLPPWSLPREQGVFRVRRLFKSTQEGILRD